MKFRFGLISLFVLTAIIAIASSWYVTRQITRELELAHFEGKWQEVDVNGQLSKSSSSIFDDPRFELLRPGLFKWTDPAVGVSYAIYKWEGKHLVLHWTDCWYECPKDFDDMWPEVSWGAPEEALNKLHLSPTRVHRRVVRRVEE